MASPPQALVVMALFGLNVPVSPVFATGWQYRSSGREGCAHDAPNPCSCWFWRSKNKEQMADVVALYNAPEY